MILLWQHISKSPLNGGRKRYSAVNPLYPQWYIEEIARGDKKAARLRLESVATFPVLEVTNEVQELAELYFEQTQIPEKARGDAYHLALATYHGMDFLVSWNFTHILAAPIRATIQDINTSQGIRTPIVCTPEELMEV